ncbi:MAG: class I adenylate-forming enzyme family protein [Acidimicrobiia bacterium]
MVTYPAPMPDLPFAPTTGNALRHVATRHPDRDFVVLPDKRATYAEMEKASRELGRRLLADGVGKGTRVGIFDTYSVEWVVVWLAVTRIGALAMPFSSIYKPAELATVMRIGDVDLLLAPTTMLGKDVGAFVEEAVPGLRSASAGFRLADLPFLRRVWLWSDGGTASVPAWATAVDVMAAAAGAGASAVDDTVFAAVEHEVVPADLAQVTYTSGSSALPKGVVHSHGAIVRSTAQSMGVIAGGREPMPGETVEPAVVFNAFPLFWIGGTLAIGRALQRGDTLVHVPRFEPKAALDMIERERCVNVMGWPSLVNAMVGDPSFAGRDLSFCLPLSGAPMPVPEVPVPGALGHRSMSELVGNWGGSERKAIDPETGDALPDLVEGELAVRGWGALQGYYKKEREETFDADGWLHTGDRVFIYDNRVFFVGRFYEMVKSQGANVSPREVETVLEKWPEIMHAFVFGTPHPAWEEEVTALVCFNPGMSMSIDEMRARAAKELSSYKVPTRIEVIAEESSIPWLGSGKPDKLAMRAALLA